MNIYTVCWLLMALVIFGGCRSTDSNQFPESNIPIAQGAPPSLPVLPPREDSGNRWNVTIQPVDGERGRFTFDASLTRAYSESDDSGRDLRLGSGSGTYEVRIPTMTVIAGEEAEMEIGGPDGEKALAAQVLIAADGSNVSYSVMIVAEGGTHRSSGHLELSVNQPDGGNGK